MKGISFNNLEEVFDCYGRENLIAIDNIKQIIAYAKYGCQPKFVWENEKKSGKITCWFLKSETYYVYSKWMSDRPEGGKN